MSALAMTLLFLSLAAGVAALFGVLPRKWRLLAAGLLAVLAIAQIFAEGFYWHFAPTYALILLTGLTGVGRQGALLRWLGRLGLLGLLAAACAGFSVLPVPQLTPPAGAYGVGGHIYRWVDSSRDEISVPGQKRNVVVQAFYPTDKGLSGDTLPYIDGLGRLPESISGMPSVLMTYYGQINTFAISDAPISKGKAKWPVVLFSPGYGGPRAVYTSIINGLASDGYVVLAVDHPYESAVVELADGSLALPANDAERSDDGWQTYMADQQALRAADMAFVLDQIAKPGVLPADFAQQLDLDHIAAIGHSFGGVSAMALAADDPRIKAVVNIDGTPYGDLVNRRLSQPVMVLQSDKSITGHSDRFEDGNAQILANATGGSYRYEMLQTNHFSFTDAPLFVSEPVRWLVGWVGGGSLRAAQVHAITSGTVSAFLHKPLAMGTIMNFEVIAQDIYELKGGKVR